MSWIMRLRLRLHHGQDGVALVVVIGVASVLLLMLTVALSMSVSGLTKARTDESWNSAIAAAYAGIEDYKSKISNDSSYYRYGNPDAPFTLANGSDDTVVMPIGTDANPAFGNGLTGPWQDIHGSDGRASYRYEVDNSKFGGSGVLRIRSTGRVGTETRSVVANLRQKGFIDFLYYTTYEIEDPELSGVNVDTCVKYAWDGRPTSGCSEIAFGFNDVINGDVHSNDTLRICNATFYGAVTTGYNPTSGIRYRATSSSNASCGGQKFMRGKPVSKPTIDMPPTNGEMINEVRTDIPEDVPRPGCLYTGPTDIVLNSSGTMTIRSPWTLATQVAGSPHTSGTTPAECGMPGTGSNHLGSPGGATITVPPQNLIFVQNVPFSATGTNPNRRAPGTYPSGYDATVCSKENGVGYPLSNEKLSNVTKFYGCSNGDVFVKGTMKGQLTIAAENYIYITGDIKYASTDSDVLGLVGNNAVWVWNPVNNWNQCILGNNRRIDAAILSVEHTFQVQNYDRGGGQGTLTVNGSIAQKFRGFVKYNANGYVKDYNYDARYRYIAPPKFLSPVTTTYGLSVIAEAKTAYNPDGSAIP